jgi:hypothetical protein
VDGEQIDMTTEAFGHQIVGFSDGGSVNQGQDVHFVVRVKIYDQEQDVGFFLAEDLVPVLISRLVTYGAMARVARIQANPYEEADNTYIDTYALRLVDVIPGKSLIHESLSLLTLQFDGGDGEKLNLYCAADLQSLRKLANSCTRAEQMVRTDHSAPPRH